MKRTIILFCFITMQLSGVAQTALTLDDIAILPKPVSVHTAPGVFQLMEGCRIIIAQESTEAKQVALSLAKQLNPATGFNIQVKSTVETANKGNIYLSLSPEQEQLGDEGYQLTIEQDKITLSAYKAAGLFYGTQTIRQLLPADIERGKPQERNWEIPAGTIVDYPEYAFRSMMLDVARHFFQVSDLKRLIDLIATYKINTLHLHLSDDQGWRIEIKKWPKLTEIGGSTKVSGGKGGFYTQAEYAGIVRYAAEKFITIIPEIDMPGHTNAALASYPELNCDGKAPELYTGTKVGFSSLCTNKEITYQFISDVFNELAAITPGPYLHIGGDESHVTKMEDYIPFVNRVQEIVAATGKQIIGWDEIALASLKPNTTVQYWSKAENALKGIKQGAKVIMSPSSNAYLDMKYDSKTKLGLHWAGYIDVDKGYNWDPATLVPGLAKENILGIEAPLWSETITNIDEIEYLVFPRLPGYAEIGWCAPTVRNWDDYKVRLGLQADRFKALKINYYSSPMVPWEKGDHSK